MIFFEVLILIGQFSYISYGIGFSKIPETDFYFELTAGSHGNPNDSATQLGLLGFAASAYLVLQNKKRKHMG